VSSRIVVTRTNGDTIGQLTANDAQQVMANSQRGATHVVLLDAVISRHGSDTPEVRIVAVICPPGTIAKQSIDYINQTWPHISGREK
jgi:hypothetical protein